MQQAGVRTPTAWAEARAQAREPESGLARYHRGPVGQRYDRYREIFWGERLPLAFCDLDLFDRNVASVAERAGGLPVRVASKSIRCRALLRRVLDAPGMQGVMCFTAAEAAFLSDHGFDDLLVAYPTVDEIELAGVLARVSAGATIRLVVDDEAQVQRLDELGSRGRQVLRLVMDVDMSSSLPGLHFGVRRSPIRDPAGALSLARAVRARRWLRLEGVLGYEAQIAGVPDAVPGRAALSTTVRALKRRSIPELRRRRAAVVEALRGDGFALDLVNGGGTGSLESTRDDPSVTELTAGSAFYAPALFDGYRAFRHEPAVAFALPVTRRPRPDIVTCHGGGYVASGAAGADRLPRPFLPEGGQLLSAEGAGEVQTPVRYGGGVDLEIGDPVFFRHAKAGELCERFEELLLVHDGQIVERVPTYRGDGQAFL